MMKYISCMDPYSSRVAKGFAAAAISIGLTYFSHPAIAADSITFQGVGGTYQEALKHAYWEPIAKRLGITINEDTSDGLVTGVVVQVKSGSPQWNISEMGVDGCAQAAHEGLFDKLDYSVIDKKGLPASAAEPVYLVHNYFSYVIAWNTKKFGANGPQNW